MQCNFSVLINLLEMRYENRHLLQIRQTQPKGRCQRSNRVAIRTWRLKIGAHLAMPCGIQKAPWRLSVRPAAPGSQTRLSSPLAALLRETGEMNKLRHWRSIKNDGWNKIFIPSERDNPYLAYTKTFGCTV